MKLFFTLLTAFLMSTTSFAQKPYSMSKDEQNGSVVFKGPVTMADLAGESSFSWMKGVNSYAPDAAAIQYLSKALPGFTLITLMGTWCEDSQVMIPKLAKVLQETKFPMSQFAMWGVDRSKQTGGIESRLYNVQKVPTIIVFKGNKEVGRIVESVNRSVEVDLAQILQKEEL